MHYDAISTQYIQHMLLYKTCIYNNIIKAHETCYAHSPSITPKISSHGLINKHEQFYLNYSPEHIFLQNYFVNTIHMNNETLELLFTANHPTSVPHCEPEIHGHFRPYTHHNTIYTMNNPNNLWTVTDCPHGFLKIPHLGSKIWDRSNGRSRPQTNRIINKILKSKINEVG